MRAFGYRPVVQLVGLTGRTLPNPHATMPSYRDVESRSRNVIETLGEAEAWLRGQPSPEVVAHIARMVADASRRLIALGGDVR